MADDGDQDETRRRRRLLGRPGVIRARFASLCDECEGPIRPGDPIFNRNSGQVQAVPEWLGPCCIEDA